MVFLANTSAVSGHALREKRHRDEQAGSGHEGKEEATVSNSQTCQSFFLVRRAGLRFLPTFTCQPHAPVLTAYVATGTGWR